MNLPNLAASNRPPVTTERHFIEESSRTTVDSERESFDFSALMKRLKEETRKTSVGRRDAKKYEGVLEDQMKTKPVGPPLNKENRNIEMNNTDFEDDCNSESEAELSWRPLDEIALKRRALSDGRKLFKPMGNSQKTFGVGLNGRSEYPRMFTFDRQRDEANQNNVSPESEAILLNRSPFRGQDLKHNDAHSDRENDTEFFRVEAVLQGIKDDIKNTYDKVNGINDFIQSKINKSAMEDDVETHGEPSTPDRMPGNFPERIVYLNHFVDPPEKQPTYLNALSNMKWIVTWPIKWKLTYFVIYHMLSYSNVNYTFSGKCQSLVDDTRLLSLHEADNLFGCYMTFYVISRDLYDITYSIREIYDMAYQYFMQYDELNPILKKHWKELFFYGLMNATMISIGALALHISLAPGPSSSAVYACLWNIGFGSSQRTGFAVMLIIFYIDLTQEGLNKLKAQAEHMEREQKRTGQNLFHKAETTEPAVHAGDCFRNCDVDILLQSTPPLLSEECENVSKPSPLLKKSSNLIRNDSLRLVSVPSSESISANLKPATSRDAHLTSQSVTPATVFGIITGILLFTSEFLQQPLKTSRRLIPNKIYISLRKAFRTPV